MVSCSCSSTSSSSLSATAMPPCAYSEEDSRRVFRDHEHAAGFREFDCGAQAGHSGSDHKKVFDPRVLTFILR